MAARGQSSLEVLVVLAALFAVFAVFLPTASRLYDAVLFESVSSSERAVLERISSYSREAVLLGPGTRFSFNSRLPAEQTRFSFNSQARVLTVSFHAFNRTRELRGPLDFRVFLPASNFSSSTYSFVVTANSSGAVVSVAEQARPT